MTLDCYIAKHISKRLAVTMLLTVGLLLIENMFSLFQFVLQTGAPVSAVFTMLMYLIPEYLVIAVPISLLLGIMLTYTKLAKDSELAVMIACQVSPFQLVRLPFFFGILFALLNAALVSYVEPIAEFRFAEQSYKTRSGVFGKSIMTGNFTPLGHGVTLHVEAISPNNGGLDGIFLEVKGDTDDVSYLTAARGFLLQSTDKKSVIFRLYDGVILTAKNTNEANPATVEFSQYDFVLALPDIPAFRDRGNEEVELTLLELMEVASSSPTEFYKARSLIGEAQRRIILILTPLFIPFLAIALAVLPVRRQSSVQIVVGIGILLLLIKVLDFGSNVRSFSPAFILWPAFLLFAAYSMRVFYKFGFTTDQHPLSGIFGILDYLPIMVQKWKKAISSNG